MQPPTSGCDFRTLRSASRPLPFTQCSHQLRYGRCVKLWVRLSSSLGCLGSSTFTTFLSSPPASASSASRVLRSSASRVLSRSSPPQSPPPPHHSLPQVLHYSAMASHRSTYDSLPSERLYSPEVDNFLPDVRYFSTVGSNHREALISLLQHGIHFP